MVEASVVLHHLLLELHQFLHLVLLALITSHFRCHHERLEWQLLSEVGHQAPDVVALNRDEPAFLIRMLVV